MRSTTTYERWDVVWAPYPRRNNPNLSDRRPALVVSTTEFNESHPDAVLMPITTSPRRFGDEGTFVLQGWKRMGLKAESAVQSAFVSIDQDVIQGKAGVMDDQKVRMQVIRSIATAFGGKRSDRN